MPRGRKKKVEQEIVVEMPKKQIPTHSQSLDSLVRSKHQNGLAGLDGVEDAILEAFPDAISNNDTTRPIKVGDKCLTVREIVDGLEGKNDSAATLIWNKYSRHNTTRIGATIYYLMAINEKEQE